MTGFIGHAGNGVKGAFVASTRATAASSDNMDSAHGTEAALSQGVAPASRADADAACRESGRSQSAITEYENGRSMMSMQAQSALAAASASRHNHRPSIDRILLAEARGRSSR